MTENLPYIENQIKILANKMQTQHKMISPNVATSMASLRTGLAHMDVIERAINEMAQKHYKFHPFLLQEFHKKKFYRALYKPNKAEFVAYIEKIKAQTMANKKNYMGYLFQVDDVDPSPKTASKANSKPKKPGKYNGIKRGGGGIWLFLPSIYEVLQHSAEHAIAPSKAISSEAPLHTTKVSALITAIKILGIGFVTQALCASSASHALDYEVCRSK